LNPAFFIVDDAEKGCRVWVNGARNVAYQVLLGLIQKRSGWLCMKGEQK